MIRLVNKLKIWGGKSVRLTLRLFYRFDRWHVFTLTERKYAQDIIAFCNRKKIRNSFAEIGCGLGDIIRNVRYAEKFGYDLDQKVLNAASFLDKISFGQKTQFSVLNFPDDILPGTHDVILMVNWIHHVPPPVLKYKIEEYFRNSLNNEGIIIFDTVQDKEYKFNHDIEFLAGDPGISFTKLGDYERMRQIWILQRKQRTWCGFGGILNGSKK